MMLIPKSATSAARKILLGRSLRAFGDGYVAILLATYLGALDFDAGAVGAISTSTLLGSALCTLALGLLGHRHSPRKGLLWASALMAVTGLAFGFMHGFWPLMLVAFVGTLNPSSGDVSVFLPLEHTVLSQSVDASERTSLFSLYSFVGAVIGACGSLAVGLVDLLAPSLGRMAVLQGAFLLYGVLGLATFALYSTLSRAQATEPAPAQRPLGPSRRRVYALAALFSVDAFGGGFIINALLTLWFFRRFGLDVTSTGAIFFATGLCNAVSFLAAGPLARRIGLINTMVFTHLPSNVLLVAAAFAPSAGMAAACLIARSFLSSMDVPTRTSYVMAVVTPPERPAAASVTAVPRSLAAAAAPALSGWLLSLSTFGWPLLIGGALKIGYDLALLRLFSRVKPPEEA
jgi:MFS family permease